MSIVSFERETVQVCRVTTRDAKGVELSRIDFPTKEAADTWVDGTKAHFPFPIAVEDMPEPTGTVQEQAFRALTD